MEKQKEVIFMDDELSKLDEFFDQCEQLVEYEVPPVAFIVGDDVKRFYAYKLIRDYIATQKPPLIGVSNE